MTQPSALEQPDAPGQLVVITSEFQVKARRPGGLKREEGLQKAEATLISAYAEINREFEASYSDVIRLADGLQSVDIPNKVGILRLRKSAGELRDVGTLAHYPLITLIGIMLVDVLNRQAQGEIEYRPEVLTCLIDALVLVKSQALRDAVPADVPELMADLKTMMGTLKPLKSTPAIQ